MMTATRPVRARHAYTDDEGRVLATKTRFADDGPKCQWDRGLNGTPLPLYRLPDVLAAKDARQTIYVTEGESDADAANRCGYTATCTPNGTMTTELALTLRGAQVIVVADADDTGRRKASAAVDQLRAAGVAVKALIPAREGTDLRDVLDAGGSLEDLVPFEVNPGRVFADAPIAPDEPEGTPWPQLHPLALHGVLGEAVEAIAPNTEADKAALLFHLAVLTGISMGRGAHGGASGAEHPARLHVAVAGNTSTGAKGMAWDASRALFGAVDSELMSDRVRSGFGSGEAFIDEVASGDERLIVIAPELAHLLNVIARKGDTLEAALRQAWDHTGAVAVLSRAAKAVAASSHVGVIGHITPHDLAKAFTDTQLHNGFANRFLWVMSRRSKDLPEGDALDDAVLAPVARDLRQAIEGARKRGRLQRSDDAKDAWGAIYGDLVMEGDRHPVLARARPHNLRLQVLFAALDGSRHIEVRHVEAAHAAWRYCHDSALYLFDTGGAVESTVAQTQEEQDLDALHKAAKAAYPEELLVRGQRKAVGGKRSENAAYLAKLRAELARRSECRDEGKALLYVRGRGE